MAAATRLWQFPREKRTVDYLDVLTSQRDLLEARNRLIDIKLRQLSAIADLYQALGGGTAIVCPPAAAVPPRGGESAARGSCTPACPATRR